MLKGINVKNIFNFLNIMREKPVTWLVLFFYNLVWKVFCFILFCFKFFASFSENSLQLQRRYFRISHQLESLGL